MDLWKQLLYEHLTVLIITVGAFCEQTDEEKKELIKYWTESNIDEIRKPNQTKPGSSLYRWRRRKSRDSGGQNIRPDGQKQCECSWMKASEQMSWKWSFALMTASTRNVKMSSKIMLSGWSADHGGVQGGKPSGPKDCSGDKKMQKTKWHWKEAKTKSSWLHYVQAFSFSISNDDGRTDRIRSVQSGGSLWRGPMEGAE